MSGRPWQSYVRFSRQVLYSMLPLVAPKPMVQIYQDATLEFSQMKVPTICKVLPLLKMVQQHLQVALNDPNLSKDRSGMKYLGLKHGLKAGLNKIDTHLEKALVGDHPLLGAGEFVHHSKFGRLLTLEGSTTPIYSSRLFRGHYKMGSIGPSTRSNSTRASI